MPSELWASQPAVARLKDGLVDAQLRRARLQGRMRPDHPEIQAARAAEAAVLRDLQRELNVAAAGLATQTALADARTATLDEQEARLRDRLDNLTTMRSDYAARLDLARQRSETLKTAERKLAEARVRESSAGAVSLVTRLGEPTADLHPGGPGKKTIVLGGIGGGLAVGVSLVLASVSLRRPRGRRASDYLPPHLRPADRNTGRRASDRTVSPEALAEMVPTLIEQRASGPALSQRCGDERRLGPSDDNPRHRADRPNERLENHTDRRGRGEDVRTSEATHRDNTPPRRRASDRDGSAAIVEGRTVAQATPRTPDLLAEWSGQVAYVKRRFQELTAFGGDESRG